MIVGGLVDLASHWGDGIVMVVYRTVPEPAIVLAPLFVVLVAIVAAFGFGVWFAAFDARFRDLRLALPFVMQLWFFVTPVVYSSAVTIPSRYRWAYHLNPMAGAVEGFRWAMLADVPGARPAACILSALGRRGDGQRGVLLPPRRRCHRRHPLSLWATCSSPPRTRQALSATVTGRGRIRDVVGDRMRPRRRETEARPVAEPFWALRHVDLEVMAGQVTGHHRTQRSGQEHLCSSCFPGSPTPTEGRAEIIGRVGSLLEVGTGFHIDLTGRENVFFSGAVLGMTRSEVRRKLDAIVEFAGVERFIDTPIKHYSSGMQVRLGVRRRRASRAGDPDRRRSARRR